MGDDPKNRKTDKDRGYKGTPNAYHRISSKAGIERRAEEKRRANLTPEQRMLEDVFKLVQQHEKTIQDLLKIVDNKTLFANGNGITIPGSLRDGFQPQLILTVTVACNGDGTATGTIN